MKSVKYTIEELRALDPAYRNEKEVAAAELATLERKLQHISAAIADSAKKGEIDTVQALQAEETAVEAVLNAKREALEKLAQDATFDRENVKNSWNEYATGFNAAFSEKLKAFRAARAALAQQFLELCELQRQAVVDLCHVNKLYSDPLSPENSLSLLWRDALGCDSLLWCDSDLRRPETIDCFSMRVKEDPIIGSLMIPPVYHKEDVLARALEVAGDLPAGTAKAISKVIIDGKPVQDPFT